MEEGREDEDQFYPGSYCPERILLLEQLLIITMQCSSYTPAVKLILIELELPIPINLPKIARNLTN